MSLSIKIKTNETLDIQQLFNVLKSLSQELVIDDSEPFLFYENNVSTRLIEFDKTEENDGYYVRKVILFSKEDCEIFLRTISLIQVMTNGTVYNEEDEEIDIENEKVRADIFDSIYSEYNALKTLANHNEEICLFGTVRRFYFGKNILAKLESNSNNNKEQYHYLIELFRKSQYGLQPADYPSVMRISKSDSESDDDKKLVVIISNSKDILLSGDVDYFIIDTQTEEAEDMIFIKREDISKIAPTEWWLFDDRQYFAPKISEEKWNELIVNAQAYKIHLNDI